METPGGRLPRSACTRESVCDRYTRLLEVDGIVADHEGGVAHEEVSLELKGKLRWILRGVERACRLCSADQLLELLHPVLLYGRDPVLDRAGVGVELGRRGGKEAAAREDAALDVGKKVFTERFQSL